MSDDWNASVVSMGDWKLWTNRKICYCEGPREIENKMTMERGGMHGRVLKTCKRCGKLVEDGSQ